MGDSFFNSIAWANGYLWSTGTFLLLMLSGIVFSVWTRMVQFRSLTHGVRVLGGAYDDPNDPGAISPFEALAASLSGTVGLEISAALLSRWRRAVRALCFGCG